MSSAKYFLLLVLILTLQTCSERKNNSSKSELELIMNKIAEGYVKLVLEVGLYKPDYVDAYYGPAEWKPKESSKEIDSASIQGLLNTADMLLDSLQNLGSYKATGLEKMRYRFLYKHLISVKGMLYMIAGNKLPFNEEAKILFDVEVPDYSDDYFKDILKQLDEILPGKGDLPKRMTELKQKFIIPVEKLDTVFKVAISECRKRTLAHLKLPSDENFTVEYIKDQPWGAYNWYKGKNFSVIQMNIERPIHIESAVGTAAHEGYPGHHIHNSLLETNLTIGKEWIEFSVYPLFSPLSLIAEGTANFGIDMIFPGDSKIEFEKEVLFPLAGLNPDEAELYYKVLDLSEKLGYADIHCAKKYLDGIWTREQAVDYLINHTLSTKERVEKKIQFIERYRSYVVNYDIGEDLVESYILYNGGSVNNPDKRWELFTNLLSFPHTASDLIID